MQVLAPSSKSKDHAGPNWTRLTSIQKICASSNNEDDNEGDSGVLLSDLEEESELTWNIISACLKAAGVEKVKGFYDYDASMNAIATWGPTASEITAAQLESYAHASPETRREAEQNGVIVKSRTIGNILLFHEKDVAILSEWTAARKAENIRAAKAAYRERARQNTQRYTERDKKTLLERRREKSRRIIEQAKLGAAIANPQTPQEERLKRIYEQRKAAKRRYNQTSRAKLLASGGKLPTTYKRKTADQLVRANPEGYLKAADVAKRVGKAESTIRRYFDKHPELWIEHNSYRIIKIEDIPKLMEGSK